MEKQNDRVTVKLTRQIRLKQYNQFEISIELASDQLPKESAESAFSRVEKTVLKELNKLFMDTKKGKIEAAKGGM